MRRGVRKWATRGLSEVRGRPTGDAGRRGDLFFHSWYCRSLKLLGFRQCFRALTWGGGCRPAWPRVATAANSWRTAAADGLCRRTCRSPRCQCCRRTEPHASDTARGRTYPCPARHRPAESERADEAIGPQTGRSRFVGCAAEKVNLHGPEVAVPAQCDQDWGLYRFEGARSKLLGRRTRVFSAATAPVCLLKTSPLSVSDPNSSYAGGHIDGLVISSVPLLSIILKT